MYIIKNIVLDEGDKYVSSSTVGHTTSTISSAAKLTESIAVNMAINGFGASAVDNFKIIDIHSFDQVNEPKINCMLFYRLADDPHRLHVYQKRTVVVEKPGYIYGTVETVVDVFRKTNILELEEISYPSTQDLHGSCVGFGMRQSVPINIPTTYTEHEMVPIAPNARLKVPKPMMMSPMSDLIDELKKSKHFIARKESPSNYGECLRLSPSI
jgi:hypothetical protein